MTEPLFNHVVHPTDLTPESAGAFCHALRVAAGERGRLAVLHVDPRAHAVEWGEFLDAEATLRRWGLDPDRVLTRAENGDAMVRIAAYGHDPVDPILEYLDEALPDLLVVATHRRRGVDRWLHREIAPRIARDRAITTLFVPFESRGFVDRESGAVTLRDVLVPVDWLPRPQPAIDAVAELVRVLGAGPVRFTLLHVGPEGDFPDLEIPRHPGWSWRRVERAGEIVETILAEAAACDAGLVAMVTKGHDGLVDAMLGSTTERVLQLVGCPVLAVPATE